MKKNYLLSFVLLVNVMLVVAQTTTHAVQRGETMEDIAARYGVTVVALKEANPYMGDKLYVGMKLRIPEKVVGITLQNEVIAEQQVTQQPQNAQNEEGGEQSYAPVSIADPKVVAAKSSLRDRLSFAVYGGLSINSWVGDYCDTDVEAPSTDEYKSLYGFHVGARASYNFYKGIFAELGVSYGTKGYKRDQFLTSGSAWVDDDLNHDTSYKTTMKTFTLDVPLYVGYEYKFSDSKSIAVKVGPYAAFMLSGEKKTSWEEEIWDTPNSSAVDRDTDKTDMKDYPDYQDLIFGVSAGVELRCNHGFVGFTYQRGLTEQIGNLEKKPYEQNMLVTIGFMF